MAAKHMAMTMRFMQPGVEVFLYPEPTSESAIRPSENVFRLWRRLPWLDRAGSGRLSHCSAGMLSCFPALLNCKRGMQYDIARLSYCNAALSYCYPGLQFRNPAMSYCFPALSHYSPGLQYDLAGLSYCNAGLLYCNAAVL
jgi:hypothetical protein